MSEKTRIIIPTYNERDNIGGLIREIFSKTRDIGILVVDDNSPDGTAQVVRELQKVYPALELLERPEKDGLGGAYIAGFRHILNDTSVVRIITMDADFSHAPADVSRLLDASMEYDLVIGSRYVPGGGIAKWELWRRILSWGGNLYVRLVLSYPIRDWTSGFTCINTSVLRKVDFSRIDLSGYAFLQELKYILLRAGASFQEIPIVFGARRGGESKISGFIIYEGILAPWRLLNKK